MLEGKRSVRSKSMIAFLFTKRRLRRQLISRQANSDKRTYLCMYSARHQATVHVPALGIVMRGDMVIGAECAESFRLRNLDVSRGKVGRHKAE
jgi:hypothetical protein